MAKKKRSMRLLMAERLEKTFADLKDPLGKTQFKRNIKKAAKALADKLKEPKEKKDKGLKQKTVKKKKSIKKVATGE